jgi:ElaB/YqjD/DUF883 family membrane-anchored ribosome-binding protein
MEQTSFIPNQSSTDQAQRGASHEELQAQTAGQYLDKALNMLGAKMRQAATLVKERAPREGVARSALETASQALDSTGQYMMREQVGQDIRGVVRRHPLRSLGVCFAAGLILGNAVRGVRR